MSNDRGSIHVIRVAGTSRRSGDRRRPRLPVVGVILVALGVLVLVDQQAPGAVGFVISAITLAAGIALLAWSARGGWGLYPGVLLTALSLPGVLERLGVLPHRSGYGTLLLGLALLLVAAGRLVGRHPIGWEAFLGAILVALGAIAVVGVADVESLIWAAVLIVLGAALIIRR